ncbi:sensor histidine kinase [Actinomadura rudentiformis]|uniref:histidine kinase n=2 Tax=Actinomadura rudentiformis TaxID=359158 RepID=A0A6H9YLE5_9ACTN|nr:sensor histidine kinase [Actinomadura rudentiformis]
MALVKGVRDAVLSSPGGPDRLLLPRPLWLRIPIGLILLGMTIGFTAGTIAIPLNIYRPAPPVSAAWFLGLAQALPLLVAPRWPLLAWRISALGFLTSIPMMEGRNFWAWPVTAWLAFMLMLFMVGVGCDRQTTVGVGTVTIVGVLVPGSVFGAMPGWFGLILAALVIMALTFGDAIGGRSAAEQSLREQEELRRKDLARAAVLEERARIARELHDVVAHHMSVIAMQAEAAPYKIPDLPDAARQTFGVVRDAARDALTETRRVVGLLRSDDEGAERAPQPGLNLLEDLLAGARRSGLSVELTIVGVPREVSAGVDLSAYRIVQESLSNASRYAPGSRVLVEIKYARDALRVTVTDDGARTTPDDSQGGGHGLVGMHERVTMLGGTLSAATHEGGGWQVVAELPYGED